MNKNNGNIPVSGGVKDIPRSKSLTPAILGMANSHGVKLSINMTSEDKKELLSQLEEWRKARREKLAASILAKQKTIEKPRASMLPIPVKSKPVSGSDVKNSKIPDRQSVFERLYNNYGKVKKSEAPICSNKPLLSAKKSTPLPLENSNKAAKNLLAEKNTNDKFHTEILEQNLDSTIDFPVVKITRPKDENDFPLIIEKQCDEAQKTTHPISHPFKDQIKINKAKPVKAVKYITSKVSEKAIEAEKKKNPLRRSISMMFRKKRCTGFAIRRSVSAKNLHEIGLNKNEVDYASLKTLTQPADIGKGSENFIKNEVPSKSVSFVTPKSNKSLTSTHLRLKLEEWLKVNGHPVEGYRHLRCFGIGNNKKSLLETPATPSNNTEISFPPTTPKTPVEESDKENITPPTVIQQIDVIDVENWLRELHRLIVELKYPSERCEEWLTAIRKKCASCTQLPIYWECLAAIHEMKGDLKSAIEDYERAIIKGGEVDVVGDSLAQLFDKMVIEQKKSPKRKLEKGIDPKNIFKSTIIKFALQQKALKKLSSEIEPGVRQQLYIATPVRRSTRIQTPFRTKGEVTSLQTLTPEVLKNVTFQPNESLLRGD